MKVSVHPHRPKYLAGEVACVSVTSHRGSRQHTCYRGTVHMADVTLRVQPAGVRKAQESGQRNVHAWGVGTLVYDSAFQYQPPSRYHWTKVTYHFNSGEFRILETGENVTGMEFPAAHIVGRDFYILDNRTKN